MTYDISKQPDIRSELIRQLRQAIGNGDLIGARQLAAKAESAMADRHDILAGQFRCLEAQLFSRSGDYHQALASSRLAASLLAPHGESSELGQAFLLSGKMLVAMGNYRESETAFRDAESLFRRCDDMAGRLDASNLLARIYFIRAEYKNAIRYLLEAIKLADQLGDRRKLAYLWGNLGRVYTMLGNFKKAAESLQLNLEISGDLGDNAEKAKALMSLGYLAMQDECLEKAEKYFDAAYPILIKANMQREQIILRTYYGELKSHSGDFTAARKMFNTAIEEARNLSPQSSLLVGPLRHLAEVELAENQLAAARRLASQAMTLAESTGENLEKGAALRILGQVAHAEEKENFQEFFTRALDIFDEIDSRFERAQTLVAMAIASNNSRRRALGYLFRAADLYHHLGADKKHQKIQSLINKFELKEKQETETDNINDTALPAIITANPQMKNILRDISLTAKSDLPVLICGETGTGKDLLARYYHIASGRPGQFVAVNCAAFPDTLLESELFGYRRGAFTGAVSDKEGLLQRAQGGTFFLDEIGEMSLTSQAKLLTVIETCRTRRLGDTEEKSLDLRILAATNCNLAEMVANGSFRRDLYYRLTGISFTLPPLAKRLEDIPLLLYHFLKKEGVIGSGDQVDPGLISEFSSRKWSGNVRQLESEVKKLVLFSTIAREDSLGDLAGVLVQNDSDRQIVSLFNQVEQFERALILRALRESKWNKSQAARSLAIHESTLRAKMKRYDLRPQVAS